MECPHCGLTNPPEVTACTACSTPLLPSVSIVTIPPSSDPDATYPPDRTTDDVSGWSVPGAASRAELSSVVQPGRVLGKRYEILELLGKGGMGAVYKALDRELDRLVALKVIRPELAQNAEALRRFKQELILARQVTHRNVIRIFDLGEADGVKFITMEYIEGQDLRSLLREKGKFPPAETVAIVEQICRALEAAHTEGVIHRDLKPQNVMIGVNGKVAVMDFGIARNMEIAGGMTQTGALLGTPEYMSPEQAKGEKVDSRSDLFSLGIMFYELLTGDSPYKAETVMASLFMRTVEPVRPPVELIADLSQELSDIVLHCLEIDKTKRYASATEILADLATWRGEQTGDLIGRATQVPIPPTATISPAPNLASNWFKLHRKWLLPTAAILAAAAVIVVLKLPGVRPGSKPEQPSIALAILPFRNASGDASLDWLGSSLADMLNTDVGQSAHLHPVSSDRLRQVLHDLQITPDATSDVATLRRITSMIDADTVVSGQFAKFGDQVRIDTTLRDLKQERAVSFKTQVLSEKDLLSAVDQLAQSIRENLTLSPQIVNELKAQSFKPSSKSLEAIRLYSEGTDLASKGNNLEALKRFEASTKVDPEFALAFAKLGQIYSNLGHDNEAEQFARKAVDLSENLPSRQRYLIAASYARIAHDYPKAIQSYENLVSATPGDPEVQIALARLYEDTGALDKARDHYAKALTVDPRRVDALVMMGQVEFKSHNSQGALDYFNRALQEAVQLGNDEAKGTALQGTGLAYRQLGKDDEALQTFQQSLVIRRRLGDKRGIAATLNSMAQIHEQLGKSDLALKSYQEALQLRQEIGDKKGLGDTLLDLGSYYDSLEHYDDALKYYKESLEVERDLGDESMEGLCLNNIGGIYFSRNDYENAVTYFQQALDLRQRSQVPEDIALTLQNLALTVANMGQYEQALKYYERALDLFRSTGDKRGAAMQSYSMGLVFGYQGRYGAAAKAKEEAFKTFQELQDRTEWMIEIQSGYGISLAEAGRVDEATKPLDEALALARAMKLDGYTAQALNFQGDCAYYRNDFKTARALYEQALQFAMRAKERDKIWLSNFNLAKVTLKDGRAEEAASAFRKLVAEADNLELKYSSVMASVFLADALVQKRDYQRAQQELERITPEAEKLDLRAVLAQDQYLQGTTLRLSGKGTEAASHYREALRYLNEIKQDSGSEAVLQRSDLNKIYTQSSRWSKS
jgi:tetratricopeptide (TPR) repeat protein/predicted Ser/Thr protein kinase